MGINNPHNDILQAEIPDDPAKRTRLVEEIKARAKGAFQSKDLHNAEMLYAKAIDCDARDHLVYSNRAAVRLLLKKNQEALEDCEKCLDIDASFIKAHFRKAQALFRLHKYEAAVQTCDGALQLHPANPEITTLKGEIETEWEVDKEQKRKFAEEAKKADEDAPPPVPTRVHMTKEAAADAVAGKENKGVNGEKKGSSSGGDSAMRGYKKTSDGRTTSYFHTELDEDAKRLIGDCKPQKIEAAAVDTKAASGGSVWNSAGTFEEKKMTTWYTELLKKTFPTSLVIESPGDLPDISIYDCSVEGDASMVTARGKLKHIQDMSVTLSWKLALEGNKEAKGTLKFESDGDGDYDVVVDVESSSHHETRTVVKELVKGTAQGVQPYVLDKLNQCFTQFRQLQM